MEESVLHVLLIEDNSDDVLLIQEFLDAASPTGFEVYKADSLDRALKLLNKEKIDLILLDLSLPDSQGLDTFFHIRDLSLKLPIIVLTGNDDAEIAVDAIRAGAQDYLVKGRFRGEFLARAIQYAVERHRMLSAFERQTRSMWTYRAYLSHIIEKYPDGIIVATMDGIIRFANHAASVLFGYVSSPFTGNKLPFELPKHGASSLTIARPGAGKLEVEVVAVDLKWEGRDALLLALHPVARESAD